MEKFSTFSGNGKIDNIIVKEVVDSLSPYPELTIITTVDIASELPADDNPKIVFFFGLCIEIFLQFFNGTGQSAAVLYRKCALAVHIVKVLDLFAQFETFFREVVQSLL